MIRDDLVIMCHEELTNEMDVLVNECALSLSCLKRQSNKENDKSLFIHYPSNYFK